MPALCPALAHSLGGTPASDGAPLLGSGCPLGVSPPHPGGLTPHRTSRGPLSLNLRSSPSRLSLTQTPYPLSPYPPTPQSPKPNPQPLSLILRPPVTRDLRHWPPGDASTQLGAFPPRMYLPFNVLKSLRSGPNLRDRYIPRPTMRWQKLRPVDPMVLELRT